MNFRASPLAAALILSALAALPAAHDARARQTCPQVSIECPDLTGDGKELTFRAVVADADPPLSLTYDWEVSGGTITSGHGTASITVDTMGFEGQSVSARLSVGGLPEGCEGDAEACTSADHNSDLPVTRLVGSFGSTNAEADRANLDALYDALQLEPGAQGYVVVYAGRRATAGEASKRGERARRYLVDEKSLEAARLVVLDGGHRDEVTYELFVVPTGAHPPSLSPTVDPSEVEIIREERRRPARKPPASAPAPKTGGAKPNP